MNDESVLVVDTVLVRDLLAFKRPHLYITEYPQFIDIIRNNYYFIDRSFAEEDLTTKQIIPYAMITYNNLMLLAERTNKQTENRLHNMKSIGIGGHINPTFNTDNDIILNELKRELNEEIQIESINHITPIGVINDDTTEVGRHHLGIFYTIQCLSNKFKVKEKDKMSGQWVSKEDLLGAYNALETWSQIIIDHYL